MPIKSSLRRTLLLLLSVLGIILTTACSNNDGINLDIEAGYANFTLKEFAKQAGVEIVYDAKSVEGITTNKVSGSMDPERGLNELLKGTLLAMEKDPKTGAFAVKKNDS